MFTVFHRSVKNHDCDCSLMDMIWKDQDKFMAVLFQKCPLSILKDNAGRYRSYIRHAQ